MQWWCGNSIPQAKLSYRGIPAQEAKSSITYLARIRVLFGTDFGPGSMTASGYPRIVKLWRRGEPMTARVIYEGQH